MCLRLPFVFCYPCAGIIPRLQSVWNVFSNDDNWSEMVNLTDSKVISQGYFRLFAYADLKNPLLEKYKFDPVDFMEGARYAFETVHKAIGSVELVNFASGVVKGNEQNDMLKATLSPQIYKATIEACRAMHDKIYLRKIDFKVHESHIVSIVTDVIQADELKKESENTDSEYEDSRQLDSIKLKVKDMPDKIIANVDGVKNSSNVDKFKEKDEEDELGLTQSEKDAIRKSVEGMFAPTRLSNPTERHEEKNDPSTERLESNVSDNIAAEKTKPPNEERESSESIQDHLNDMDRMKIEYPIGSVVATATVYISGEETIEYVIPAMGPSGESLNKEQTTPVRFSWTFRGCISDHSELDWKIIALDGFGDTSL